MRVISHFIAVFLLSAFPTEIFCSKLNLPRVLLPIFRTLSVNFTLEVTGDTDGCFTWSTPRSDLVSLKVLNPNEHGCSSKVQVHVVTHERVRSATVVLAKDESQNLLFRADIILAAIHSLNIVTTTRQLYLEESPELFEVRAYDEQGNEFTTLEGVEFQWLLYGGPQVLKFITFRESPYEVPNSVVKFDQEGLKGHIVLLEGVRTGSTKVSVQIPYPEYRHVSKVEVLLNVIDNLLLHPQEAFIMIGDKIKLYVAQERQGRVMTTEMALYRFSLSSENPSVASVDGCYVVGHSSGTVKVILHDKNSPDAASDHYSMSTITVALPFYLTLSISPYNKWILLGQQEAVIYVDVFDKDGNKFLVGQNAKIKTVIRNDVFTITSSNNNGTVVAGYGQTPGTGEVYSSLVSSMNDLTVSATLQVYPQIKISPKRLVVPWDSVTSFRFSKQFYATGGDGSYVWHVTNSSVVDVSLNGLVHIKGRGTTLVYVCVVWDNNCFAKAYAEVLVLEPSYLEIKPDVHEAIVGEPIKLHINIHGQTVDENGKTVKFSMDDCQYLNFKIGIHESFTHNSSQVSYQPIGSSCATVEVIGSIAIMSKVSVSYQMTKGELKATTAVATYERLIPLHPAPGRGVVLALGTSRYIVFTNKPSSQFGNILSSVSVDEKIIHFEPHPTRHSIYVYSITCVKHGETKFTLTLTTNPLIPNCKSIQIESTIDINCAYPTHLNLLAERDSACPAKIGENVYAKLFGLVKLKVILSDHLGRPFDNATSLLFNWNVDRNDIAVFNQSSIVHLDEEEHEGYVLPLDHYKFVQLKNVSGTVNLNAQIIGYRRDLLEKLSIKTSLQNREQVSELVSFLEGMIIVNVVNHTVVEPRTISVVNHPNNVASLFISNGSGYYAFDLKPKNIAKFEFEKPKLFIIPQMDGQGVLSVRDLCALGPSATAFINVLKIALLKVEIPEKVLLRDTFHVTLRLMDGSDQALPFSSLDNTDPDIPATFGNNDILKIESWDFSPRNKGVVFLKIRASALGETSVAFKYLEISSQIVNVQVFQAIKIVPPVLTLTIGAEVQVDVIGGPLPDPGIVFSVGDPQAISVTSNGIVRGLHLGHSTLSAMALGSQGQVYSKDSIEVRVVHLSGIKISTPISRLGVGNTMPITAYGVPNSLTPFILGSVTPSLIFKWSVLPSNVAQLKDVLEEVNIEVRNEDRLSMRLVGLKPGHAQVLLSVTGRNADRSVFIYNSSIDIEIFDLLQWTKPWAGQLPLVVAPGSEFQVDTNKLMESSVHLKTITLHESDQSSSFSDGLLEVSSTGVVTTGTKLGSSIIVASLSDKIHTQQSVVLNVAIKEIRYIMINVVNVLEPTNTVHSLPQGLVLRLNVTYHDHYGSIFHAFPSHLRVDANLFDKVQEAEKTNNIIGLNLERPGSISLRIRDKSSANWEDFAKIPVESHITPNRFYLSLDELVCLSIITGGKDGKWSSEKNTILVDKKGMAYANKLGTSIVSYTLHSKLSTISTSATFEVLPVHSVSLKNVNHMPLTNKMVGHKYSVLVQLLNEKQHIGHVHPCKYCEPCDDASDLLIKPPFKCEIQYTSPNSYETLDSLFSVKPDFDKTLGSYVCVVSSLVGPSINSSIVKSNITLHVVYQPRSPSVPATIDDSITLNFVPGFYVASSRLFFSPEFTSRLLVIVGVPDILETLQVECNAGLIGVTLASEKQYSNTYLISLDKYFWSRGLSSLISNELVVNVHSPLLKQTFQVPVFIDEHLDHFVGENVITHDGQQLFQLNVRRLLTAFLCSLMENPTIISAIICIFVVTFAIKYVVSSSGSSSNSTVDMYREMGVLERQFKNQHNLSSSPKRFNHQVYEYN